MKIHDLSIYLSPTVNALPTGLVPPQRPFSLRRCPTKLIFIFLPLMGAQPLSELHLNVRWLIARRMMYSDCINSLLIIKETSQCKAPQFKFYITLLFYNDKLKIADYLIDKISRVMKSSIELRFAQSHPL